MRATRRRWRVVAAGLAATCILGGAGVATAAVLTAHTGKGPSDAEDVELGGPGERLNPAAPDFAQVLDEISTDIRFPTERARTRSLSWEVADLSDEQGSLVSTGALRLWMAGHALCSWSNTWASAHRAGDRTAEDAAAGVIRSARSWPAIADTDPQLSDESPFSWLPTLEKAILDHDITAAKRALSGNQSCMPGLAPELGMGRPL